MRGKVKSKRLSPVLFEMAEAVRVLSMAIPFHSVTTRLKQAVRKLFHHTMIANGVNCEKCQTETKRGL